MLAALHNFAISLAVVAAFMLVTALAGFGLGEQAEGETFAAIAVLTGFIAGGLYFATRREHAKVTRRGRYVFAVLAWTVPPLLAAIPIIASAGGSYASAVFEAISGVTTTGGTVFAEVDALPRSVALWRAELHWLGGFLTLVLIVTVLAPAGIGGVPGRDAAIARRVLSGEGTRQWLLIRDLLTGYVGVTAAAVLGLVLVDIPAFDALCIAMSAISTGGFLPNDGGLAAYVNPAAEIITALAMLVGATSIVWHRMLIGGRWADLREHRESYWLIAVAVLVGVAFAVAFAGSQGQSWAMAAHRGLATGASLVSTTGMDVQASGFAALPVPVILLVVLVGGGAFSTAGGLRFFRVGGMIVESFKETRRLIYPHGVRPKIFGAREFDVVSMKAIWSLFTATLALLSAVALALTLTLFGMDLGGALAATVSAFSNVGGVYSSDWAEAANWPAFSAMPPAAQLLLAGVMIVGRLEIIAIVVAVSLVLWRS